MKLDKLSAWAEIISSVAILGTLIFLVVQTRQNSEAIKANTRQQMLATDMEFLRDIFNDPSITTLQYKTDLNNDEKSKLAAQYTMFLRQRESNWIQYRNGALDALTWESMKSTFNIIARQSNFQLYWNNLNANNNTQLYAPDFVKIVDDIVKATPPGDKAEFIRVMERPAEPVQEGPLSWLVGCWQTEDGLTREIWEEGAPSHLFGYVVVETEGGVGFYENLRLVKSDDGYVYSAFPSGSAPTHFTSVEDKPNRLIFENKAHDYPQRIVYVRDGDALTATISLSDGANPKSWNYESCLN